MDRKNILLRLDPDMAERLQAVADVEGRSMSDVVREAIAEHIDRRRTDPQFQQAIRESLTRHRRLMKLLAEEDK
jgi:predicted transcriptional regulator